MGTSLAEALGVGTRNWRKTTTLWLKRALSLGSDAYTLRLWLGAQ